MEQQTGSKQEKGPQSLPASGSFQISQLFTSGGQSIGISALASVLPMNILGWFLFGLIDLLTVQGTLKSSTAPQFKSINSSPLSLLHGPSLTSVHDYWKNHPSPFSEKKTGPRRARNGQKPHGRAGRAGTGLPHLPRLTGPPQPQALAAKPHAGLICLVSCPLRECFVHSRYSHMCVKWMKVKQQVIWEFQRYFFS